MVDDNYNDLPALDPPNPDNVYRNYLRPQKRVGVTRTTRDRAKALILEWTDALAARR